MATSRPISAEEIIYIIQSKNLSSQDIINFCSINRFWRQTCNTRSDRIWTFLLKRDYPNFKIVGDPRSHYEKLYTNTGTSYWFKFEDNILITSLTPFEDDVDQYHITILGNQRPKGEKLFVALAINLPNKMLEDVNADYEHRPNIERLSEDGIICETYQDLNNEITNEPQFLIKSQSSINTIAYPARVLLEKNGETSIRFVPNPIARELEPPETGRSYTFIILQSLKTDRGKPDYVYYYWNTETNRYSKLFRVENSNPYLNEIVQSKSMEIYNKISKPLFELGSQFASDCIQKINETINETLSAEIQIVYYEFTLP